MRLKAVLLFLSFSLLFSGPLSADNETLATIESRPGVRQKFILIQPPNPTASVILFAGGHGALDLAESAVGGVAIGWGENNFLVRTRRLFADHGFTVAVVDAPSDKKKMNAVWRMGAEHAQDVLAVIQQIKKAADVPVWVVGTSMGTFSAANAAVRLEPAVSGLVLTSTITRSRRRWKIHRSHPKAVIDMALETIRVPTLIAAHESDGCRITPASDAGLLKAKLKNARTVKVVLFQGGDPPRSDPCQALSEHGFLGIEKKVVDAVAEFIEHN